MILNWGGSATISITTTVFVRLPPPPPPRKRPPVRTLCLASTSNNINTPDQLRAHLDQLHAEADTTRTKGSNARLRLMRLSEAAEKLQRQALVSVQTGRENDARELLFQKKKVMQALEKTKSRIELLDELNAQLNKAITLKETQLVGTVAQDLEISREDTTTQVRIVSPKEEATATLDENGDFNADSIVPSEDREMQVNAQGPPDPPIDNVPNNPEVSLISAIWSENDAISCLKGISSFENFLEHLDKQLSTIEAELATVLRFSTLVMDGEEKPKNSKVQQTMEIFEGVCRIRARIASIMQEKVQTG